MEEGAEGVGVGFGDALAAEVGADEGLCGADPSPPGYGDGTDAVGGKKDVADEMDEGAEEGDGFGPGAEVADVEGTGLPGGDLLGIESGVGLLGEAVWLPWSARPRTF